MKCRTGYRVILTLGLLIGLGAIADRNGWIAPRGAHAQQAARPEPQPGGPAAVPAPAPSEEEKAIRAADEAFVGDYNRGDSKALAARFADDAEVIELEGVRYEGRELIERRLADTFAASPGVTLSLEIEAVRLLHPDVAKEEGRSRITPAKGAPESRRYTILYVKRDGRWLISSVREELDPLQRPHDRLKELEWMVGDWVDEGSDSEVRLNCRWSEDGNFLIRSFTVKQRGQAVMTVTQRIGWDPLARRIRSWEFDSEGGFGEGKWSRDRDRWIIKHEGVRPDGMTASATNTMTRERPDLIRWVSVDRVFGTDSLANEESYVLVRVAPPPRLQLPAPAPSPSSSTSPATRSPR